MTARLICGDVREVLATLDAESVQTVVTSPPYFGLRDYGVDGQIGLEPTPQAFVAALVDVFREVRRVLRPDGTVWLNLGDSYAAQLGQRKTTDAAGPKQVSNNGSIGAPSRFVPGLKPKDLIGIPWRVAFALQQDGWWLRSDIIWAKPNPMPESVTDRPTKAHEYIFLLTKQETYFYDADAIAEDAVYLETRNGRVGAYQNRAMFGIGDGTTPTAVADRDTSRRNRRSVWTVATQPFSGAHFATFPEKLIEPCILAGTSERGQCPACGAPWRRVVEHGRVLSTGGSKTGARASNLGTVSPNGQTPDNAYNTGEFVARERVTTGWQPSCTCDAGDPVPQIVLDPFAGSGTTGVVALRHGRSFVGVELNPEYARLAERRITNDAPLFNVVEVA